MVDVDELSTQNLLKEARHDIIAMLMPNATGIEDYRIEQIIKQVYKRGLVDASKVSVVNERKSNTFYADVWLDGVDSALDAIKDLAKQI